MQLEARRFQMPATGPGLPYLLAVPVGYRPDGTRQWPLLLYLHGRGERGDDLRFVKRNGLPRRLVTETDFPFIMVAPQCPAESDWSEHLDVLCALLDEMATTYAVDRRRVYLTGLSMGGRGAWLLAARQPQRFAALVPICGRIPPVPGFLEEIAVLKEMPVWVFHGAEDQAVSVENSDKLVAALRACGGDVHYTRYPDADHDSWSGAYATAELYPWLLQYARAE